MPVLVLFGAVWCFFWVRRSYPRWQLTWRNRWRSGSRVLAIENGKVDRYLLRAALVIFILYLLSRI